METVQIITNLLMSKGVAPSRMCRDLGFSSGLFTQWKQGLTKPSAEKLAIIAGYLNVSVDYLLGKNAENKKGPDFEKSEPQDPLVILNRNAKKMSAEKQKKLLEMAKVMFKEDFGEDG